MVGLDQLTKSYIVNNLLVGESRPFIGDVVSLTHVRNPGAAFGLLEGWSGFLALAALIGVIVVAAIVVQHPPPITGVGAALVGGGALGNLIDRVARGWPFHGEVVDFIDLGFWPSFNVADSAISVGAVLLILSGVFERTHAPDTGSDAPPDRGG